MVIWKTICSENGKRDEEILSKGERSGKIGKEKITMIIKIKSIFMEF